MPEPTYYEETASTAAGPAAIDLRLALQALDQVVNAPLSAMGVHPSRDRAEYATDLEIGSLSSEPTVNAQQFQAQIAQRLQRFENKAPATAGGKRIAGSEYKLEKLDPKHRVGFVLKVFLDHYQAKSNPQLPFFQWLDSLSTEKVGKILDRHVANPAHRNAMAQMFTRGVDYLDAASRMTYSVGYTRGLMQWQHRALDTTDLETKFSGKGWAIWVLSPETKTFYTNSHKVGEFHHSSFLQGKKVVGAGEWKVTNGKLSIITGKTGHYRCGPDELASSLRVLFASGVNLMMAKVKVYDPTNREVLLSAFEYMNEARLRAAYKTDSNAAAPTAAAPGRNFSIKPKGPSLAPGDLQVSYS